MFDYVVGVFVSVVSLVASYGGVRLFIVGMQYLKTKTKSSNLKLALDWGIGAVTFAEQFIGTGQEQRLSAINALRQRLDKNNKLNNFTDEQIEQIIQQAYAQAKANGLIEAVAKTPDTKPENETETSAVVNGIDDPTATATEMGVQ